MSVCFDWSPDVKRITSDRYFSLLDCESTVPYLMVPKSDNTSTWETECGRYIQRNSIRLDNGASKILYLEWNSGNEK